MLLLLPICCYSQKENNIWTFGKESGLDFSDGTPHFFSSKTITYEGCATVCSANGELLFYSNGTYVWNRNHELMPNGSGLLGNSGGSAQYGSATQGVIIVPFPNNINKYYLFTIDCSESQTPSYSGYLRYSIIDMDYNNGLGDIVTGQKNIVVDDSLSERMTVSKGGGCYYWLIAHKHSSNEFRAYTVDDNGIGAGVSSFTSSVEAKNILRNAYMIGELKISPSQQWLASANPGMGTIELYRFNNLNGRVTQPIQIHKGNSILYGVDFSPDNTKLYVSRRDNFGKPKLRLLQFDLSLLPDLAAVKNSSTEVGDTAYYSGMRLGPDGRLYIAGYNNDDMHVINNPNLSGNLCDVQHISFPVIDTVNFYTGYGTQICGRQNLQQQNGVYEEISHCFESNKTLTLTARNGFKNYIWNNGNNGNSLTVAVPGYYTVTAYGNCGSVTDTFNISTACNTSVYIPSAFTPNGDGHNDYFRILGKDLSDVFMVVHNRWGNLIYTSTANIPSWDGTHNGTPCDIGTYFYIVTGKCHGIFFTHKGDVTLVR